MTAPRGGVVFATWVAAPAQVPRARLLVASLRDFGGRLAGSPVWIFDCAAGDAACGELAGDGVQVFPAEVPAALRGYLYASKVAAAAAAEARADGAADTLVMVAAENLVVGPVDLLDLGGDADAALRPVHHRNVGLGADAPLDAFWRGVYANAGVADLADTVESFIEGERLRAYFNSALYAVRPALGLLRRWCERFTALVGDEDFQRRACGDRLHQVFLHQAVLTTLLAVEIAPARRRLLPPGHVYPYNLHGEVPADRRAKRLEELATVCYEERSLDPAAVRDIAIGPELAAWLAAHGAAAAS
ncbi:MAG: hypothetical protein JW819_12745 [Candidatus Krumholzibacteriota bacterium]|nr:hypothetical protein [Candidatus Krumholzibacteriota bacterium]